MIEIEYCNDPRCIGSSEGFAVSYSYPTLTEPSYANRDTCPHCGSQSIGTDKFYWEDIVQSVVDNVKRTESIFYKATNEEVISEEQQGELKDLIYRFLVREGLIRI